MILRRLFGALLGFAIRRVLMLAVILVLMAMFGVRLSFDGPTGPSAESDWPSEAAEPPSVERIMFDAQRDLLQRLNEVGAQLAERGTPGPLPAAHAEPDPDARTVLPPGPLPSAAALEEAARALRRLPQITGGGGSVPIAERKVLRVGD